MVREDKITLRSRREKIARVCGFQNSSEDTMARTAARTAYRAKIELLLDESKDERLADVWQRVCPFPVDPACELPDRRGIIEDLADFGEVLQPNLRGMEGNRLCRLIEKYAACDSRPSSLPSSPECRTIGTASF